MYVMSLVALYCPTNFIFLFLKKFVQRLCNSSVPMDCTIPIFIYLFIYCLKHNSRPNLTSHYSTLKVKLNGRELPKKFQSHAHQWVWTQNLFEFPSQTRGLYHQAITPRPECSFSTWNFIFNFKETWLSTFYVVIHLLISKLKIHYKICESLGTSPPTPSIWGCINVYCIQHRVIIIYSSILTHKHGKSKQYHPHRIASTLPCWIII
jgi:hypothetical protein